MNNHANDSAPAIEFGEFDAPIEFREGGNCIFYAMQEAFEHFYDSGFGEEEFDRFRKGIETLHLMEKEELNRYGKIAGMEDSLLFLKQYAREKFIEVEHIYTPTEGLEDLDRNRLGEDVTQLLTLYPGQFRPPAFVITRQADTSVTHVFFVKSAKDYNVKLEQHVEPGDNIMAIMTLRKTKEDEV